MWVSLSSFSFLLDINVFLFLFFSSSEEKDYDLQFKRKPVLQLAHQTLRLQIYSSTADCSLDVVFPWGTSVSAAT